MAGKSSIETRNTVVFTTLPSFRSAAASTAARLSSTRTVCASMPPSTSCPESGSSGFCPEQNPGLPAHRALRVGQEHEGQPPRDCEELVLGGGVERCSEDLGPRLLEPLGSVTEPFTFLRSAAGGRLGIPPEHHPAAGEIGE